MSQATSTPRETAMRSDARVRTVELLISNLLRLGVITSLLILLLGESVSFIHHPAYLSNPPALRRLTTPGAAFPHSLREVLSGVRAWRGQAIVMVGLLLLIATPVVRVAVSIIGFAFQHDYGYVVITSIVLALLVLSFVIGAAE
jgi:uncharacterized membrane protein